MLTPRELNEMAEGHQRRQELEMEKLAWHAANLMNIHLKKKVSVNKLLGRKQTMSKAEKAEQFAQMMQKWKR
ncbi:hypothetical protein [Melghirimyces algeriensis]|uniref:Uncharacterized protein n=1 Tax=Melghirimyces algeriensis TaxID=910412 RepID=A0A521BP00_9BACL|nr:hypothetical protein SAMN06264849_102247 [Melghirimyces algeriensis]